MAGLLDSMDDPRTMGLGPIAAVRRLRKCGGPCRCRPHGVRRNPGRWRRAHAALNRKSQGPGLIEAGKPLTMRSYGPAPGARRTSPRPPMDTIRNPAVAAKFASYPPAARRIAEGLQAVLSEMAV